QWNTEEFNPLVWGLRFNIGSDGKPIFEQFGNTPQKDVRGVRPSIDREPLVDVIEEEEVLRVIAEVPGVSKEQISLSATENKLLIEAKSPKRNYFKELELPIEIIPEHAKARFKNGVLEVTFQRKFQENPKTYKNAKGE
ncbi:MAG: archaeal heat shock protein Hsp20, partial [Candidatus Hodarchaeota archaeon]